MDCPEPSLIARPSSLNSCQSRSIVRMVAHRELGLRSSLRQRVVCRYELNSFPVTIQGRGQKSSQRAIKEMFPSGGILGVSHNEKWLVGFNIIRRQNSGDIYMMKLFPGRCYLEEMLRVEDFPEHGLIFMYFPHTGLHTATLIFDYDQWKSRKPVGPSSVEMSVHFFYPSHHIHFTSHSVVTCIRRLSNKKALTKAHFRVHNYGGILNCGQTLINFNFTQRLTSLTKTSYGTRTIWAVSLANKNDDDSGSSLTLDLGERVSVCPTQTYEIFNKVNYQLTEVASDENDTLPDVIPRIPNRPPLLISRQCVDIEKVLNACMNWAFKRETSAYQGFVDYETEIAQIEDTSAFLLLHCVGEFQMKKDGSFMNKFFVVRLELVWDLFDGGIRRISQPTVLRELTPQQAYDSSTWYPLGTFPVEPCNELMSISSAPMLTGKNEELLLAPNGSIAFICDKCDSQNFSA
ncbi:unnamed protein product, partial [Mesorhabditis belari]|uniref:Uncharacterized protein n=1 Tax=Mesorhabditis belari TaxID=2138241 RepID=A0AAF3EL13_9BILA